MALYPNAKSAPDGSIDAGEISLDGFPFRLSFVLAGDALVEARLSLLRLPDTAPREAAALLGVRVAQMLDAKYGASSYTTAEDTKTQYWLWERQGAVISVVDNHSATPESGQRLNIYYRSSAHLKAKEAARAAEQERRDAALRDKL